MVTFEADTVQVEFREAPGGLRGRVQVRIYLDGGEEELQINNVRLLNLDGVWVHTKDKD